MLARLENKKKKKKGKSGSLGGVVGYCVLSLLKLSYCHYLLQKLETSLWRKLSTKKEDQVLP